MYNMVDNHTIPCCRIKSCPQTLPQSNIHQLVVLDPMDCYYIYLQGAEPIVWWHHIAELADTRLTITTSHHVGCHSSPQKDLDPVKVLIRQLILSHNNNIFGKVCCDEQSRGTATAALLEFQFSVCKEPTRDNVTAELLEQDQKLFPELWDGKAGVDRFHPSISLSLTKSLYINRLQQISKWLR